MEQHQIPRQITTFEFKLVGFMTLKQFLYLVVFMPLGYIVFKLFPIPLLNFVFGLGVALFGVALAFLPINERPFDVYLKNLIKRLISPTQYFFQKDHAVAFLNQDQPKLDQNKIAILLDAQKKLVAYLSHKKPTLADTPKQAVQPAPAIAPAPVVSEAEPVLEEKPKAEERQKYTPLSDQLVTGQRKPFITGTVKNNKKMPLPGLLLYIKDQQNSPIRLLKTNPHGVFATYSAIPPGEYTVEVKDPKDTFFFDTMKIKLGDKTPQPLELYSREMM